MKLQILCLLIIFSCCFVNISIGQDPVLPATNLGFSNIGDGFVPGPGVYFINYTQIFESRRFKDGVGRNVGTEFKIGSLLNLTQLIYVTKTKFAGGNLGFTTIIPIVKISATSSSGLPPSVNPHVIGDIIPGAVIQWMDKKFIGKPLFHRVELSTALPVGSYNKRYAINPSAHLYTFSFYHAFSYYLNKDLSLSMRNTINYNTEILRTETRPGSFFTSNFSVEQTIYKSLRFEIVGYYLTQLENDSYAGNHSYYQEKYGIKNTKERVIGLGPGIGYLTSTGLLLEGKVFFEALAKNRFEGVRPTLRVVYKLNK